MSGETTEKVSINQRIDILFTIVDRGKGEEIVETNMKNGVLINMICPGRGTAPSSILEMFGLGDAEKDVVLSIVDNSMTFALMSLLSEKFEFGKPGSGICFAVPMQSLPIQSFSGLKVRRYLAKASFKEENGHGK